jgi:hypothetical protein
VLAITAITMACFFLNAVFAFAIAGQGPPLIRPAFHEARSHLAVVLGLTLQAGTTSAVKAIKMGARLTSGYRPALGINSRPAISLPQRVRDNAQALATPTW